jgi:hypothetical protein
MFLQDASHLAQAGVIDVVHKELGCHAVLPLSLKRLEKLVASYALLKQLLRPMLTCSEQR